MEKCFAEAMILQEQLAGWRWTDHSWINIRIAVGLSFMRPVKACEEWQEVFWMRIKIIQVNLGTKFPGKLPPTMCLQLMNTGILWQLRSLKYALSSGGWLSLTL